MNPAGLYNGPRNGNMNNSEAQFQGRVVENAWVDQNEIQQRTLNAGKDKLFIYPYAQFSPNGPEICTLKTNEIALKKCPNEGSASDKDFENIYKKGVFDVTTTGEDNGYPFILSSFNGVYLPKTAEFEAWWNGLDNQDDMKRAYIRQKWQLAGIVGTNNDSLGFHGQIGRPDLPVQLGGVYTISNFGDKTINQGDLVVWNAPILKPVGHGRPHVDETPDGKLVVATEPYDPKAVFGWYAMRDAINVYQALPAAAAAPGALPQGRRAKAAEYARLLVANVPLKPHCTLQGTIAQVLITFADIRNGFVDRNDLNALTDGIQEILDELALPANDNLRRSIETMFECMARQRHEYNSRIVGRATTTGLPGNDFNIYMGNYCV